MANLSEEMLNKIKMGGMVQWSYELLAEMLGIDVAVFQDAEGEAAKMYRRGALEFEFQLDAKLAKAATENDLKALEKLEERQRKRKMAERK